MMKKNVIIKHNMPPASIQGMNPHSGPLQEAIARRAGALNQQGPGSATPSPLPSSAPAGNPQMVPAQPGAGTGQPQQVPQQGANPSERVDDAHIILKAMAGRLKSQEKIAEAMAIPPKMPSTQGM